MPLLKVPAEVFYKRVGVCIVVYYRGEILVCKRLTCRDMNGLWQNCGGAVEDNESTVAAAYRELQEETGLKPEMPLQHLGCWIGITSDNNPMFTTIFLADFSENNVQPIAINTESQHGPWEWCIVAEYLTRPIIELTRDTMEKLAFSKNTQDIDY